MRENDRVQFSDTDSFEEGLQLAICKWLSIFGVHIGGQTHVAKTTTATIGTRVYLEYEEDVSYACTCYGKVDTVSIDAPSSKETITSVYYDVPRYITQNCKTGSRVTSAPMKNHIDAELTLIEQIASHTSDFTTLKSSTAPRKRY